ncbi:unnamed protein product [Moneuplotes crassus]|uniref:ELM2 domain-containing protein n=1 Tax=Euplotes crassus TaxID=5936 RepID=A0AAD1Y4F6_EUPCR|nr:unnamed protein product [Moneuplotes crassus]
MEKKESDADKWLKPKKRPQINVGMEFQACIPELSPPVNTKEEGKKEVTECQDQEEKAKPKVDDRWMKPIQHSEGPRIGDHYQAIIPDMIQPKPSLDIPTSSGVSERKREKEEDEDLYGGDLKRQKKDE